tara:strand:+ start:30055 stop:30621 length:567 start_codon:yes stop_codon:yes gene_type:complete
MMTTVAKMMVLAVVCGLLLSTGYLLSGDQITQNQQALELQQLTAVIGDPDIVLVPTQIATKSAAKTPGAAHYRLLRHGAIFGQLRSVSTPNGYNGKIRFWLATTLDGEIIGVRVIEHQETPGLGDKLDLDVSDWVLGFNGASLTTHTFDVKKFDGDFDQFSGATITPRAVIVAMAEELKQQQANGSNQ